MKLQRKQSIGKYDVVIFPNINESTIHAENAYMVQEILSVTPNGSMEVIVVDIGKYADVINDNIGFFAVYDLEIFPEQALCIGNIEMADTDNPNPNKLEKKSDSYVINPTEVSIEEVLGMITEMEINDIVMDPEQAKVFIDYYRNNPINDVKKQYDIRTNAQLMRIVDDIVNMYRARHK